MQCEAVKFIYSEKATKFCEIFSLLLTVCTVVKSKVKISQNFLAFSKYMNFNTLTRENSNSPISNNISQRSKFAFCKVQRPFCCSLHMQLCSSNAENHTSDQIKENGKFHLSVLLDETIP